MRTAISIPAALSAVSKTSLPAPKSLPHLPSKLPDISPRLSITAMRYIFPHSPLASCLIRSRKTVVFPLPGGPAISSPPVLYARTISFAAPRTSCAIRIFNDEISLIFPFSFSVPQTPARFPPRSLMYPFLSSSVCAYTELLQSSLKLSASSDASVFKSPRVRQKDICPFSSTNTVSPPTVSATGRPVRSRISSALSLTLSGSLSSTLRIAGLTPYSASSKRFLLPIHRHLSINSMTGLSRIFIMKYLFPQILYLFINL